MKPLPHSPMAWGTPARVNELLGDAFEFGFEERDSMFYAPSPMDVWREHLRGFGPIKSLTDHLPTDQADALRADFLAFHEQYRTDVGLTLPRTYLLATGTRI
ncbi:MAG: hypothetical protein AAGH65_04575 [Pseudomonadota bacterium]